MQKSKMAFTMIELIFVIVILGILSTVAIPRFSATRADAEISKMASNISTGAMEIALYAVAKTQTESDLSMMSNSISNLVNSGDAVLDLVNKKATLSIGTVSDCVIIQVLTNATDDNLTIIFGNANGDSQCIGLQSAIDAKDYPIKLRGKSVTY